MATRGNSSNANARPIGPGGAAGGPKMLQFKLVLLGESAVGKSSLVLRFVKGQFHEYQESTIGGSPASLTVFFCPNSCYSALTYRLLFILAAAFLTQTVVVDDTTVKFEIWDTAGQERYHSLAPMYYRCECLTCLTHQTASNRDDIQSKLYLTNISLIILD